jgi:gamma-glutamyltranspeptidase/glutathione hydrolase
VSIIDRGRAKEPAYDTLEFMISITHVMALAISLTAAPLGHTAEFDATRGDRASGWLPQSRSEVLARNGIVATSQPLAAQAGLQILKNGGNAIDAAVATAAVLNVVEPGSAGIGGDVFVIAWLARENKLVALNGSGRSPSGATPQHLALRGATTAMPSRGIDSATAPGAVDAWDALLKRAGSLSFKELLQPAVDLAEQGFAVSERIHNDWVHGAENLKLDAESVKVYLPDGRAPAAYSVFRNPDLARAFRVLQAKGRDAFYQGEIASAMLAKSRALGGTFTAADLANTRADWVAPISTNYHGYDVFEFPPNTQGFAVLEMLNILEVCAPKLGIDLAALGPRSALYWHVLIEAKKLAYADLYAYNADPKFAQIPLAKLISKTYAAEQCQRIDLHKASVPAVHGDPVGGTVYLATADRWGNMVSFIYSIYESFGSGITVPGYGFVLNDRGALFSMDPGSPNRIAPGKRPFHTLLPGFVMKDGRPWTAFGLMGGSQQAQGHVQVLINLIDLGANLQAASDAARFSHAEASNTLELESSLYSLLGGELKALGHSVTAANGNGMGGYQAVSFTPFVKRSLLSGTPEPHPAVSVDGPIDGVYRGASDHRKDGQAVGW